MSNTLIRDGLLLAGVCVFGAWYLNGKADGMEERIAVAEAPAPAPTPLKASGERFPVQHSSTGAEVVLFKERGQFYTDGRADRGYVRFLVDTGASSVALRMEDALAMGFKRSELNYTAQVSTANGVTRAAPVTIKSLTIGPITERNVRALVIEEGLEISLLGMTFLGRLQSFEANRDTLTLRL